MVAATHKPLRSVSQPVTDSISRLQPQFILPYYSHAKTCLHRYLDSRFIERFNQEINNDLNPDEQTAWMNEDIMGPHNDLLTLRQPVHRTFYMVSCAISCQNSALAALAPDKISSAGFVIRKKQTHSYSVWSIENGTAAGWYASDNSSYEPDIYRRLKQQNIVNSQTSEPLYNGEEVHPMHIKQISTADGKAQTIAYGYLPIGGSYTPPSSSKLIDGTEKLQLKKLLPWNSALTDAKQQETEWQSADGLLVSEGQSTWRFAKILRQAINNYHIGEHSSKENELSNSDLFNKFNTLFFFRMERNYRKASIKKSSLTLAVYLENIFANQESSIHDWLQTLENTIDSSTIAEHELVGELPELNDEDTTSTSQPLSLQITQSDAQELNYLFSQRLQQQLVNLSMDIPLPKFSQNKSDIYFVQPFIRTQENCQESIHWGEPSPLFRVAAPFDPEASRPALIQMPSLDDVRRGMARGVNFLTPASMAKKLKRLRPGEGLTEDIQGPEKKPELEMGMICSFSLPIVTLCAMILLMIVISVLNFIFRWIPWVFTCLPYPKTKT